MKYEEITIGLKYESSHTITSIEVEEFARLSGDTNPIHIDDYYAEQSIFKQKIVHGMFVGAFISKAIASNLPGPGSIYLNQTMNFLKPVYHDSRIEVCIEVESLKEEKNIVFLKTTCRVAGDLVIDGTAVVKCLY
jgi:3-hydroxybutyryl-CoA dehydratase